MLSPEYIFASSHDDSILFWLYPCVKTEFRTQIRLLAEYFLEHIDHEEEQVVNIAYRFYRMTREENFEYSRIVEEIIQKSNEQEWKSDEKKDKEKTTALALVKLALMSGETLTCKFLVKSQEKLTYNFLT